MIYFKSIFPLKESKKAILITAVGALISALIAVFLHIPALASLIAVVSIFWATSEMQRADWKIFSRKQKIIVSIVLFALAIVTYYFFWKQFSSDF